MWIVIYIYMTCREKGKQPSKQSIRRNRADLVNQHRGYLSFNNTDSPHCFSLAKDTFSNMQGERSIA